MIKTIASHQDKTFGFRIPAELKTMLQKRAVENGRSLNSEMIIRLRDSLEREQDEKSQK